VPPDDDGPKFNDDLLANPGDRQKIVEHFPTVIHILDQKELQDYFRKYKDAADAAKRRSRTWGGQAIALGTAAILLAGLEIIAESHSGFLAAHLGEGGVNALLLTIALIAAGCGIASLVIGGFGVLFGSRKREWLHNRFMAETIRQFHFQTLIARLPDILESLQPGNAADEEKAKAAFATKRAKWLSELQHSFEGHIGSRFESVIGFRDDDGWLHGQKQHFSAGADRPELEPLFAAYRQLRIHHQLNYVNHKLGLDYRIFSSLPRRQAAILQGVSTWGIAMLFTIHIVLLVGVVAIALSPLALGGHESFVHAFAPVSGFFNAVIIAIPVVILATRAIENGLMPEWEIDRYEKYRAGVDAILRKYDASDTQAKKLHVAREMERLAFDEMRDFLRINDKAIFVM